MAESEAGLQAAAGAHASTTVDADRVEAPRICLIDAAHRADDACLRSIARLHFNWLAVDAGLGTRSAAASAFDRGELLDLRARADRHGLNMLVDLDVGRFNGTSQESVGEAVSRLNGCAHGIRAIGAHQLSLEHCRELIAAAPSVIWFTDTLG